MDVDYALAVTSALTGQQQEEILDRFLRLNPGWTGAGPADIIEALTNSDSDLGQLEPFFEANPGLPSAGAGEAARALLWSGQDLTAENMRALLGRALAGAL